MTLYNCAGRTLLIQVSRFASGHSIPSQAKMPNCSLYTAVYILRFKLSPFFLDKPARRTSNVNDI